MPSAYGGAPRLTFFAPSARDALHELVMVVRVVAILMVPMRKANFRRPPYGTHGKCQLLAITQSQAPDIDVDHHVDPPGNVASYRPGAICFTIVRIPSFDDESIMPLRA